MGYAIDPRPASMFSYQEEAGGRTHYFTGEEFKDFSVINWDAMIPVHMRKDVLVVLDDHQSCIKRVRDLVEQGFVHVFYDDQPNYFYGRGDTYSFNAVCAPLPRGAQ